MRYTGRNEYHDAVPQGFAESMKSLDIGYIDLYVCLSVSLWGVGAHVGFYFSLFIGHKLLTSRLGRADH
jgi:hypothetical protein